MTSNNATNHGDVVAVVDDDTRETSPESAALARGAARAAMTSSSSSASASARGAMRAGRVGGGKALAPPPRGSGSGAANLIAKATDRASVGLDVINAGLEHRDNHHHHHRPATIIPPTLVPPRNLIAKASDRASVGLKAIHAGMEPVVGSDSPSSSSSNDAGVGKKEGGAGSGEEGKSRSRRSQGTHVAKTVEHWSMSHYPIVRRAIHAAGSFVTNAMLGMAVFATYESTIERMVPTSTNASVGEDDDGGGREDGNATTDAMDRATLSQHVLAGAAGGSAHALLSLALEMRLVPPGLHVPPPSSSSSSSSSLSLSSGGIGRSLSSAPYPSTWWTSSSLRLHLPPPRHSLSTILHHTLSHSALFGTYQLSKRSLNRLCLHDRSEDDSIPRGGRLDDDDDVIRFATIAVSGGLAGQCQHVVGHISERWLGLVAEDTRNHPPPSSSVFASSRRFMTSFPWPTWRSTALTFPLSAVGFLAYEYGKLMMTDDDGVDGMA